MNFNEYQHMLKPIAVTADKSAFERWDNKHYDIEECWRAFCKNNGYPEYRETDLDNFQRWLYSLGYIKRRPRS